MFLSDSSIRERLVSGENLEPKDVIKLLEKGHIVLSPFPSAKELDARLGQCSLDLQLGTKIRESTNPRSVITHRNGETSLVHQTVDFRKPETLDQADNTDGFYNLEEDGEFILEPKGLVRAVTLEFIGLPADLVGFVHSRSRCGRYGISSSYDAPKIDPGFVGQIVLEISNMGLRRFSLHPGLFICQIIFAKLDKPTATPYYARKQQSWRWQTEP
jgi:deoxycytidine triphosphate deaminase